MKLVCAQDECDEQVIYGLFLDGIPLAHACILPHLAGIMRATRHLGDRRLIKPLEVNDDRPEPR